MALTPQPQDDVGQDQGGDNYKDGYNGNIQKVKGLNNKNNKQEKLNNSMGLIPKTWDRVGRIYI